MTDHSCYRVVPWRGDVKERVSLTAATYILTMEDDRTHRLSRAIQQVRRLCLSPRVYIVYNRGFRNCNKQLREQNTGSDLNHANMHIARHALNHFSGQLILLLEDDFFWVGDIERTKESLREIRTFLQQPGDIVDHYSLGSMSIPFMVYPSLHSIKHWRVHCAFATQAMIHTPNGLKRIATRDSVYDQIDIVYSQKDRFYMYWRPLTMQVFTETENQKMWRANGPVNLAGWMYLRVWGMDKDPTLGWYFAHASLMLVPLLVVGSAPLYLMWEKMSRARPPVRARVTMMILLLFVVLLLLLARPVSTRASEAFRARSQASKPIASPTTTVVGIEGITCAGKSTLAKNLRKRLEARGYRVNIINQDKVTLGASLWGMNHQSMSAELLCKPFISSIIDTVASGKYDIVIVEGHNCTGRCGKQSAGAHLRVHLRYTGNCHKDGRRSLSRAWWTSLGLCMKNDSDHLSTVAYTVDSIDPDVLADAVLGEALRTHLQRTGELVET